MEIFTYKDYLKYQGFLARQEEKTKDKLRETEEIYNIYDGKINHEHDKIFRRILADKREVVNFINKALKLKIPIIEEQLEKYNSSFVTLELKNQEADIIYKLKGDNIFFLIEHQTKIDYAMPLRILEYSVEIIKSAIDKKQVGKREYKYPAVIPIVLYSGIKKWKVEDHIQKTQSKLEGYKGLDFAQYNVIDINDYTEEELLHEESFLSKIMLIEKARYTNNLAVWLEEIVGEVNSKEGIYTKEQKELLITIIEIVLKRKIDKGKTNKLIKSLEEGGGQMLAVLEMIDEENKRIFRNGKKEGKLETAKKMLKEDVSIEFIMKVTELSKEEINKLKK